MRAVPERGIALSQFGPTTRAALRAADINPELAAAIGLRESEDRTLSIPFTRHGHPMASIEFSPEDGELDPWPEGQVPGAWWPVAPKGSTVIVCLGAGDALVLSSLLYCVGHDGDIYRRPNLPSVLSVAVPVALPDSGLNLPLEWIASPRWGVDELVTELMCAELQLTFLTLPRQPADLQPVADGEPALEAFIDAFLEVGSSIEVVPALALLPPEFSWRELLSPFRGAAKVAALGGILEYWRQIAVAVSG